MKTLEDFPADHICNKFRRFFDLSKPVLLEQSVIPSERFTSSKGKGKGPLFVALHATTSGLVPSDADEQGTVAMDMSLPSRKVTINGQLSSR
jgi:hypothetical protein